MLNLKFLGMYEFHQQLQVEKKRAQRSGQSFILILLTSPQVLQAGPLREQVLEDIRDSVRDTDICGWYTGDSVAGVIFTEVEPGDASTIGPSLVADMRLRLKVHLSASELEGVSFSIYPDSLPQDSSKPTELAQLQFSLRTKN